MGDIYPPKIQRPALLELQKALDSRRDCLRKDECGDWAIFGKVGHIYAVPNGFQLVIFMSSAAKWNHVKERLNFCEVTQDGDEEGCLILAKLPSTEQGLLIRKALGIFKAMHLTNEQREKYIERLANSRFKSRKQE